MLSQEERLINLYEALGYCDVYETKENIYDIIQKDDVKVLCDTIEDDSLVVKLKVDMKNFNKEIPLLTVIDDRYMPLPSKDYILINNTIYILNPKKRLYTLSIVKIK